MGHLAQRYLDPSRSGVYRVTDDAVPRRAAVEAGSILTQIAIGDGVAASEFLETLLAKEGATPEVLIIHGADCLAIERGADFSAVVEALDAAARERRGRGAPFFVVLVDPRQILALPALYKERAAAG